MSGVWSCTTVNDSRGCRAAAIAKTKAVPVLLSHHLLDLPSAELVYDDRAIAAPGSARHTSACRCSMTQELQGALRLSLKRALRSTVYDLVPSPEPAGALLDHNC